MRIRGAGSVVARGLTRSHGWDADRHHAPYFDMREVFAEELRPIPQKLSN